MGYPEPVNDAFPNGLRQVLLGDGGEGNRFGPFGKVVDSHHGEFKSTGRRGHWADDVDSPLRKGPWTEDDRESL
ncbi:hypothetical protein OFM39_30700 [Escherichia coli]|nr:hypothetical protein [Escherichia coli]